MTTALIVLGCLFGIVGVLAVAGLLVEKGHTATVRIRLKQPRQAVWTAVTEFETQPQWRPGLKKVERLEDRDGKAVWREHGKYGTLTYAVEEETPPDRLVTRILDERSFGGSWTLVVGRAEDGCTLTATESGEIYNPVFRFMAKHIFGYHKTLETYCAALARHFGESVVTERIDG